MMRAKPSEVNPMNSSQHRNIEDLALAGELARQLCHDFNNFLYNLFLQIEIATAAPGRVKPQDWDAIKRAGEKVVGRIRDWDRFHARFSMEEEQVDLHQLIERLVKDTSCAQRCVELKKAATGEPVCINSASLELVHLLRLLLEEALDAQVDEQNSSASAIIDASRDATKACIRINAAKTSASKEDAKETLQSAACRSLAVRLGADIRRRTADGRLVIEIDLPLRLMGGRT
jgi:hypothetical protein